MTGKYSQTYSKNRVLYELFEDYKVEIEISENPYDISPNFFFTMAARKNLKRGFLFVSKVLGKHTPVLPAQSLLAGILLGIEYSKQDFQHTEEIVSVIKKYETVDILESVFSERIKKDDGFSTELIVEMNKNYKDIYEKVLKNRIKLKEKTLFIGFAETATALGHSVYELFENCGYIHTTREYLNEISSFIDFCEEHSHATEHFIYSDSKNIFEGYEKIVLIDDELTTGKTALNFIRVINKNSDIRKFAVLSLLDWRNLENTNRFAAFQEELGITIETASLIKGEIKVSGSIEEDRITKITNERKDMNTQKSEVSKIYIDNSLFDIEKYTSFSSEKKRNNNFYLKETGRFLIENQYNEKIDAAALKIAEIIKPFLSRGRVLFSGTSEFIYLPLKISEQFDNALFQSTTRSPIYTMNKEGYGVKSGIEFRNIYDHNIANFFYNIEGALYEQLFILIERDSEDNDFFSMLKAIEQLNIREVYLIIFVNTKDLGGNSFYVEKIIS